MVSGVGAYVSRGCYSEGSGGRALGGASWVDKVNMTVEGCVGFCNGVGWSEGRNVIVGRGWGGVAGRWMRGGCGVLCKGSAEEFCGGSGRLNVYAKGG